MIGRLNHVAIAVPDLDAACRLYRDTLGAVVSAPVAMPAHGVTTVFVSLPNTKIELLQALGEESPIVGARVVSASQGFLRHPDRTGTSLSHGRAQRHSGLCHLLVDCLVHHVALWHQDR
jgi:catechol 2,3-dioxygenase-like lactoylglutathione lyase family enzyme